MTSAQRILIVSGSYPRIPCGVAGHVHLIADRTAARPGHEVHVLTSADDCIDRDLPTTYTLHPDIADWTGRHVPAVGRAILELAPDVVHLQNPTIKYRGRHSLAMSRLAPWLKRRRPDLRLVVMQHDIAVGRRWFRWRYWPLLHAADAVVVSNQRDYQAVRGLGIAAAKLYQAPVGTHFMSVPAADADARRTARQKRNVPDEALCVAYLGYIHPERNLDVLLDALGRLHQRGVAVRALILGAAQPGCEDYYRQCQADAHRLRLGAAVHWAGFASEEEIVGALAAADVFVSLPQRGADMRNTSILTAIRAEVPVITAVNPRYHEDPELAALGCITLLPRSVDALVAALEQVRHAPPTPGQLAQRRAWVDPQRIWKRHIDVNLRAYAGLPPEPLPTYIERP